MTGCAYVDTNIVYAKNGSKLRRAEAYLGNKNVDDPPATACAVTGSTASR